MDANSNPYPISPEIYGIANGVDTSLAQELHLPNVRWGGDGTTRYNWQVDSSNAGFDWYFMGGNGQTNPTPGASVDQMIRTYQASGTTALITIPIIPYVNKLSAWNCSFPEPVYGAQQSYNPYVHPNGDNCGNSITTGGAQLTDNNIYANHIDNSATLEQSWVEHLVATLGDAEHGGIRYYQLDNEPFGWNNTHRDVMPNGATYSKIEQLGEQYAAAIKIADPTALVFGPSDFTLGGWVGNTSDPGQEGLFAGQFYLKKMAAYQAQNGQRILDYLDEHYYPQFSDQVSQLASTRTLWDPTYNGGTWVEQYDFNGPMQLIPRFQRWVSQYYPGTKISLSEYSIASGRNDIVDALTEMDVLGIFGRQQLDFANMWSPPAKTDPIAYSFRMFLNYDGNGSQYGSTWVNAASSDQGQLSIYAAQRSSDNVLTVLVINKTTGALATTLALSNFRTTSAVKVFSYSAANLTQIVPEADAPITSNSISYTFPAYSATMFVVAQGAAPPPVLAATTTTLQASAMQLTAGQSVTLMAKVSASGSTPAGTVSFSSGTTALGTATLTSGSASFITAPLAAGTYHVIASYSGSGSDQASTSSAVTITVVAVPPANPDYTLNLGTESMTTQAGSSGQMQLTVTPLNGFGKPLNLACSGLPSGATCSFNPAVLVAKGSAATATLTIATKPVSSLASSILRGLLLPFPLLMLVGMGRCRWTRLGCALLFLGLCGCGAGTPHITGSGSGSLSTGSYSVTVIASGSGASTHQQVFTLVIQ